MRERKTERFRMRKQRWHVLFHAAVTGVVAWIFVLTLGGRLPADGCPVKVGIPDVNYPAGFICDQVFRPAVEGGARV